MITQVKKLQQRLPDLYFIPHLPFERFIREIAQDYGDDIRFSKQALCLIQKHVEYKILSILQKAALVMVHTESKTLYTKDIRLARKILSPNPYYDV
jgi:histone H3